MKIKEFNLGKKDCQKGVPHSQTKSKDYTLGYAREYEAGEKRGRK